MKFLMLAIVMVVFAACGENEGNGTPTASPAMGRYVEVDITPPNAEGRLINLITQDDVLLVFDEGLRTRFESNDMGVSWTQSLGPGHDNDRFETVFNAGILPDGRLLVYLQGEGIVSVEQDGTTAHFPISSIDEGIADGEEFNVSLFHVLDDERIMLVYGIDWIARIMRENQAEEEGGERAEGGERTTNVRVGGRFGGGGGGMGLGMSGITTAIYSLITGQQTELVSYDEFFRINPMGANTYGDIFAIENHNLVRHESNGDVDILLHGTAFAFGAPTVINSSVQPIADGFIVNVMHTGLFKYIWDADAYVDPAQTITIWSLEDSPFVRAAITEVWRNNPNAEIIYEIALGDTGVSAADAVRTLNTRLLSGRGPDILILDGTPIDSYVERGMLLDIFDSVDTSGVYQSILTPFTNNGQMNVIPTQFLIPVLMGAQENLYKTPTLSALVQAVVEGNPLPSIEDGRMLGGIPEEERAKIAFNDLAELFDIMWQANAAAFISDNQLNSDVLYDFLYAIEAIRNKYELPQRDEMMAGGVFMAVSASGGGRTNPIGGSIMRYVMQSTNIAAFEASNLMLLASFMGRDGSEIMPFPGMVQGAWTPSAIVGISADTAVADFAIEFVNTMLSPNVQNINHGVGLPVTRDAMQWQIAQINEQMEEFNLSPFTLNMDALIAQLQTPALPETTLREMVWNTVERLDSIEGAVQEIEQNIRNYLAERS
ncbi:MAG: hypothetical protein FWF78_10175 [Defluviitaleaceae bacterium]|nr:hypothetical protein [Defluviitaleaceae bacterium]